MTYDEREKELKQVNLDIIFFFLLVVSAMISFYIINEKKKSLLNIKCISNKEANDLYHFNRVFIIIISAYFLLNVYLSYNESKNNPHVDEEKKRAEKLLLAANVFAFIGVLFYLPLGNSNLIIER